MKDGYIVSNDLTSEEYEYGLSCMGKEVDYTKLKEFIVY